MTDIERARIVLYYIWLKDCLSISDLHFITTLPFIYTTRIWSSSKGFSPLSRSSIIFTPASSRHLSNQVQQRSVRSNWLGVYKGGEWILCHPTHILLSTILLLIGSPLSIILLTPPQSHPSIHETGQAAGQATQNSDNDKDRQEVGYYWTWLYVNLYTYSHTFILLLLHTTSIRSYSLTHSHPQTACSKIQSFKSERASRWSKQSWLDSSGLSSIWEEHQDIIQ